MLDEVLKSHAGTAVVTVEPRLSLLLVYPPASLALVLGRVTTYRTAEVIGVVTLLEPVESIRHQADVFVVKPVHVLDP